MFSASVVLKHIHKVTEKLIFTSFTCPFEYCDIERPRLSELRHTAQKDGKLNLNDTKAKRIENSLKYKAFGIIITRSCLVPPPPKKKKSNYYYYKKITLILILKMTSKLKSNQYSFYGWLLS